MTRREWLASLGLLAAAGCGDKAPEGPAWVGHLASIGTRPMLVPTRKRRPS